MDTELIVLLDEKHEVVGTAPKLASHNADTPLHQGFSCYIFNEKGQLLMTQRAPSKKVWPGVWTNSACGHPGPGESVADAVQRRTSYELGLPALTELQEVLPDYSYKTPPFNGIIENEFCPVYFGRTKNEPQPNPAEVENYRWLDWQDIEHEIAVDPTVFSYWFKDQLGQLLGNPTATTYLQRR